MQQPKPRQTKPRQPKQAASIDVLGDVLHLFGGFNFTAEELAAEIDHYCRIIKEIPPHPTAIGKRLASIGYVKTRERIDGKKVSLYTYKLKLAARA